MRQHDEYPRGSERTLREPRTPEHSQDNLEQKGSEAQLIKKVEGGNGTQVEHIRGVGGGSNPITQAGNLTGSPG